MKFRLFSLIIILSILFFNCNTKQVSYEIKDDKLIKLINEFIEKIKEEDGYQGRFIILDFLKQENHYSILLTNALKGGCDNKHGTIVLQNGISVILYISSYEENPFVIFHNKEKCKDRDNDRIYMQEYMTIEYKYEEGKYTLVEF